MCMLHTNVGRSVHNILRNIKKHRKGFQLHALKTIKFDGTSQKIPVTNLYTDLNNRLTSGDTSEVQPRFDWVSLKFNDDDEDESLSQVQLLTLLRAMYPKKHTLKDESGAIYFFIAADSEKIKKINPVRYQEVCIHMEITSRYNSFKHHSIGNDTRFTKTSMSISQEINQRT